MGRATIGRMTDAEFLRRIDQHIAVANEHMARGNEHTARGNELWAEARQGYADLHGSIDDLRVELRQTGLRGQRVAEWFAAEVRESRLEREADRLEREADRREREADRREDRGVLRELVEESRAQRSALLAILDEIRGGGGPAAAGA
jgi:hypothetical protein